MQSDDDLQTTLSKWPFILGDVLLVATALAIAILGDWQLSNWQVAACVVSVALGAALFVLPYVVEFKVRVREEAEDRRADLRVLQRHLGSTQDQLEAVSDRIEAVEGGLTNLAQTKPGLSEPLEALEKQIEPLRQSKEAHSEALVALAKQAGALGEKMEALELTLKSKPEGEAIETLRSELAALQAHQAQLGQLAELPTQAPEAPEPELPESPAQSEAEPKAKKTREPRKRRQSEPRLLNRAIEQKRDHSSAAVSRIIETKKRKQAVADAAPASEEPAAETKEAEDAEPPAEVSATVQPTAVPTAEPVVEEATEIPEPSEPEPEPKQDEAPEPEPEAQSEPEPKAPPEEAVSQAADAEPPVGATEDMFADAVPPQVAKRARTKKSDTAVIASVFIGIGNKPYLRGSGAGLNWESGVAMEFEEIGKWRWLAPADLETPIELQLFRNDEDPDSTGKYTLEPGQQLDLSPVF